MSGPPPNFKRARKTAKQWLDEQGAPAADLDNLARAMLADYESPQVEVDCIYFFQGHECNVGERRLSLWFEPYGVEKTQKLRRYGSLCEECRSHLRAQEP